MTLNKQPQGYTRRLVILSLYQFEPRYEKTPLLHMRKQRRRTAPLELGGLTLKSLIPQTLPCIMQRFLKAVKMLLFFMM